MSHWNILVNWWRLIKSTNYLFPEKTLDQRANWKNSFFLNFTSIILLFQLFKAKNVKKHILNKVCSSQLPNVVQTLQQISLLKTQNALYLHVLQHDIYWRALCCKFFNLLLNFRLDKNAVYFIVHMFKLLE